MKLRRVLPVVIISLLLNAAAYAVSADEYAQRATDKAAAKDYKGAVADYDSAIRQNPAASASAGYYSEKAVIELMNLKNSKQAMVDIDKAIALDPANTDYPGIKKLVNEALTHPKAFESFLGAKEKFDTKDYPGVITVMTKTIELNPDFALYYAMRAMAKAFIKDDLKSTLADFDKAIALDKEGMKNEIAGARKNVLEERGNAAANKISEKDYNGAIADLTQLIAIVPDYPDYYMIRGVAYLYAKQYDPAKADIKKAIALEPSNLNYTGFAVLIDEAAAHPKAYEYYTTAQDKFYAKEYKEALDNADKAVKANPAFGDYYVIRGLAKYRLADNKGALADMEKSASLDPDNKTHTYNRDFLIGNIKKASENKKQDTK